MKFPIDRLDPEMDPWQRGTLAMDGARIFTDCQGKIIEYNYLTKKLTTYPAPNPPGTVLASLRIATVNQLVFNCFRFYDTTPPANSRPTLGVLNLETGKVTNPWVLNPKVPNLMQRGATINVKGEVFIAGGGYYSIFQGGSWGPTLVSKNKTFLSYPVQRCKRPSTVILHARDWVGTDPGLWTAGDYIGGDDYAAAAVKIDDRLIYFVSLAEGRCAYGPGGIHSDRRRTYLFEYSWSQLQSFNIPFRNHTPKITPFNLDVRGVAQVGSKVYGYVWPDVVELSL
jgi:hypothetical protein